VSLQRAREAIEDEVVLELRFCWAISIVNVDVYQPLSRGVSLRHSASRPDYES
jgi:hypothetical protein